MRLLVRHAGHIHGMLFVYRADGELPFTAAEATMLSRINGFIAHGLAQASPVEGDFLEGEDRAFFIADHRGSVCHADAQAQHLLMMALNPRFSPHTRWRDLGGTLFESWSFGAGCPAKRTKCPSWSGVRRRTLPPPSCAQWRESRTAGGPTVRT
jgi:hypothetical protein